MQNPKNQQQPPKNPNKTDKVSDKKSGRDETKQPSRISENDRKSGGMADNQ